MENINVGIANLIISEKLKKSYFQEDNENINESKERFIKLLDVIKNSPILQLESKIFNNIENKHIDNDIIATRYIDNNIKLFEYYTIDEINNEHNKLNEIIDIQELNDYDLSKLKLYQSINNLILESVNNYDNINVDNIHESFTTVLNHIKTPKLNNNIIEENNNNSYSSDVIKIAVDKFNDKYHTLLNEDDKQLLFLLIKSDNDEKIGILENYKKDNLTLLSNVNNSEITEEVTKAIGKINNMKYSLETINEDIISLHELKSDIIRKIKQ